jgi:hypothetical protein
MDSCLSPIQRIRDNKKLTWYFCLLIAASVLLQFSARLHWFELPHLKGWITLTAVLLPCISLVLLLGYKVLLRRKVQVSLRQSFFIITAIAVPLAGLGHEMQQASRQRKSLVRFQQNQGSWFRYRDDHDGLRKTASWPKRWLFDVLGDDFFFNVAWLDISATSDGFEHLNDIRYLYGVNLRQCRINDNTLALLREQPYLTHLGIDGTSITDKGLLHLHSARNLQELWLRNTDVTQQGIQLLQTSLPNCRIHHSLQDRSG